MILSCPVGYPPGISYCCTVTCRVEPDLVLRSLSGGPDLASVCLPASSTTSGGRSPRINDSTAALLPKGLAKMNIPFSDNQLSRICATRSSAPACTTRVRTGSVPRTPILTTHWNARECLSRIPLSTEMTRAVGGPFRPQRSGGV